MKETVLDKKKKKLKIVCFLSDTGNNSELGSQPPPPPPPPKIQTWKNDGECVCVSWEGGRGGGGGGQVFSCLSVSGALLRTGRVTYA